MPYVELKLVGKLSKEQKAKIVEEFTRTLQMVAKKPRRFPSYAN
jgi:4-oxalocrotonate tautomerase